MTADDIWKNDALMAINAELGLPMWKFTVIVNRIAEMEREECAKEAEHWQLISTPEHKCGDYIAAAIRSRSEK